MSGFHGNTSCLTAALQELFSAAGSSLTPVCQGGMREGEYDPAHTRMQHNLFIFFILDSLSISLHLTFLMTVEGTFHHRY